MMLQVARFLIKSFGMIQQGKPERVSRDSAYLLDLDSLKETEFESEREKMENLDFIERIMAKNAGLSVERVAIKMMALSGGDKTKVKAVSFLLNS